MINTPEINDLQRKCKALEEKASILQHSIDISTQRDYRKYRAEVIGPNTTHLIDRLESVQNVLRDTKNKLAEAIRQERQEKYAGNDVLEVLFDINWEGEMDTQLSHNEGDNTSDLTPQQVALRGKLEKLYQPQIDTCIKDLLSLPKTTQSDQGQRILEGLRTPGSAVYAQALKNIIQKKIETLELELCLNRASNPEQIQQFLNTLKNHPPLTYKTQNNVVDTLLKKVESPENKVVQTLLRKIEHKNE